MTIVISTTPSKKQKETLGKFFKQRRLKTNKSVEELALLISRSTHYYYRLEKGEINTLDVNILRRLFKEFNVAYDKTA